MKQRIIDYGKLKPGMIVGTTDTLHPMGIVTRATEVTQSVDSVLQGLSNALNPDVASHIFCIVEEHELLYGVGMKWPKVSMEDICDYQHGPLGNHIVFVADPVPRAVKYSPLIHDEVDEEELRIRLNKWLLECHKRSIKYDLDGLLAFWHIAKDDPRKLICSELAREMLYWHNMYFPSSWMIKVSPFDIQRHYTDTAQLVKWWR